jgi:hypothetical protein
MPGVTRNVGGNGKAGNMEYFDKRMALEVIEDALTDLDTPYGRGMAAGLCGAFHMCGLLTNEECESILKRVEEGENGRDAGGIIH